MLSSTALRLTRTVASSGPSLAAAASARAVPSLCDLFDTSLHLSWRHQPSAQISSHQLPNVNASPLNIRQFSSKSEEAAETEESSPAKSTGSAQHETWVEFQKSISVSGFETGQTTKMTTRTKKRGGTTERKRRQREEELEAALKGIDITTLKGGEFPPLRYSDEETARLLEEAYANIPPRAGKRGTRYLKREKKRWWIKRMYDAKKKHERMAEHERRMAKRHNISKWIYEIQEGAPDVRRRDEEYQRGILERWAQMNGYAKNSSEGLVEQNE